MQNQIISILTSLGLTDKEAKVYLACIERGTAVVSEIGEAAGINRVTTYDILEKLKQKGLVSYFTKKKIKYFSGVDPETVIDEYEKRTRDLKGILPELKRLTGQTAHPRIQYFEGLEGIKTIYADTLTSKTEILNYSNSAEIRHIWPTYDKEYVEKRATKKIYLRGIIPQDSEGEIVHSQDEKYFREMRMIDPDKFTFTNEINIYDDKVAIISFKDELIGMIIQSSEIANSQRAIFNMCWEAAALFSQRTKMLTPLKGSELKESVQNGPKTQPVLKDNLSLF